MPGFTSPTIMFLSTWDAPERGYLANLLPKLRRAGYTDYHEPAVGGLAMPLIAENEGGYKTSTMTVSDTHLFSSVLGALVAGDEFSVLGVHVDGEPFETQSTDRYRQAAEILHTEYLLRMETRPDLPYWNNLIRDLVNNESEHIDHLTERLKRSMKRLEGLTYRTESVWNHLERVKDNPNAVVVSNPPTYPGAYEQFFDTNGRLTWNQPDYEVFDAPVDIPRMVEEMEGQKALLLVQQQQTPRNSAHREPVYARQLSAGQLVYINSNRPDEVIDLVGRRVVPLRKSQRGEREWPVIPDDYQIDEDSVVTVAPIESKVADAYRDIFMHRLYAASNGGDNLGVFVDGYMAGVVGYNMTSILDPRGEIGQRNVLLRYAFGAKHQFYRLTRLATMLAIEKNVARVLQSPANALGLEYSRGLITVEMTRHPEAKGLRGIMKLNNRDKHPDGYRLVYEGEWTNYGTPQAVAAEWLKKEKQYLKSTGKLKQFHKSQTEKKKKTAETGTMTDTKTTTKTKNK